MKKLTLLICALLTFAILCIGTFAAETVIYENDFSDPSTLSDFTQFRHAWEIKDGGLYATSVPLIESANDDSSHIIYNSNEDLADYIVEVDCMNVQSYTGLLLRTQLSKVSHARNATGGYFAYCGKDANKGAFGHATDNGKWGGEIVGGPVLFEKGTNVHIKAIVKGDFISVEMTNLAINEVFFHYNYGVGSNANHTIWNEGTVGFRTLTTEAYFDNLKITTANEVEIPDNTPVEDYKEGISFAEDTGRYMLAKDLSEMPLTLEATVYFPYSISANTDNVILGNYRHPSKGFIFRINKGGHPNITFYIGQSTINTYTFSGVSVYRGKKTHVAIALDTENSLVHCYIDGTLKQSLELAVNPKDYSAEDLNLGTDHREANTFLFKGSLINLACYSDMRTAEEIKADVSSYGKDDLTLRYDLTNASYGENITDLSGNGIDAIYEQYWYNSIKNITDYAYSIAVVGDSQHSAKNQPEVVAKMFDWIKANAEKRKMAFMVCVGDFTNDNTDAEWTTTLQNIARLDGVLPYALAIGNHDGTAQNYTSRFTGTEYEKAIGNNYYSNYTNSYQYFKVGYINYIAITLDYSPSNTEIEWAKKIAAENPYHRVILVTHSNINARGETTSLWNKLIKDCPNIEMVLSGHYINDKIVMTELKGVAGNTVHNFMINGQSVDATRIHNGEEAAGLVAMLYFDESGRNLTVEYYSTSLNKYFMECNQFSTTIGNVAGDVDYDGALGLDDVLKMIRALLNNNVCYNGDMNNDIQFDLSDVMCALNDILK